MPEIDAPSRTTPIVLWVLRVLVAALFLIAAFAKLTSMQMEVDTFAMLPVGQWFRYLVGLLELAGGICVLIPAISGLGAIVLLVVDVGAFFAQILFLHQDWIHPIVIGAILVALIYLQRDAIRERLGMQGLSAADGTANEFSFCTRIRRVEAAMPRSGLR